MKNYKLTEINPVESCFSRTKANYQRHEVFEILWFKENLPTTYQKIDHQKYRVPQNSIFLLGIGQTHLLSRKLKGYSICLSNTFFQQADNLNIRIMFNPFINEPLLPDREATKDLESILDLMIRESKTTNYQPVIHSYLAAFIYKLSLLRKEIKIYHGKSQRLAQLFELIENYRLTERNASFYADKIGLTPKRLNEILKDKVGFTLTQLLHRVLIADAKKMIAKGDKSIKEVSYDLGFSDQAYFSRFFKKQTGMPPAVFYSLSQAG